MLCKGTTLTLMRCLLIVVIITVMAVASTSAEGLFSSMNQMFGISMPSIGVALGRNASAVAENENGKFEAYSEFSYDDYLAFGSYLAGVGATLNGTEGTPGTVTVILSVRGALMQFTYNWQEKTATVMYPPGTRPETGKENVVTKASILPPACGIMPSAQFAVGRKPDSESTADNGITQIWANFTDLDYNAFSIYLAQTGAILKRRNIEGGILAAEISLYANSIIFTYDWRNKIARVFYPNGTSPEREKWNILNGNGSILPDIDTIGKKLPSMSRAIFREPDSTETLTDGSQREIYNNFQEADYTAFSQYLQTTGCIVDGYHVEDGRIMVFQLSNLTGTFVFTYDTLFHLGTVIYPKDSQIEAAWTAPTAAPNPAITRKPSTTKYTVDQYVSIATEYIKSLLANPSSFQIRSYKGTDCDDTYLLQIKYSEKKNDGKRANNIAYIWITKETGSVYQSEFK